MTKRFRLTNKIMSVLLCLALLLSYLPTSLLSSAATDPLDRVVDDPTVDDWKNYFGKSVLNTQNAGGVWGDKSVFKDASHDIFKNYNITLTDSDSNFLVALSAIASNKSIVGYSTVPTDTVLVLDLSNSMTDNSMTNMIKATNDAIRKLLNLNYNNRVGVVLYAGTRVYNNSNIFGLSQSATTVLPLGRYEGVNQNGTENFLSYSNDTVSVINGVLDLDFGERNPSKSASGATYIQSGIQLAWNEFNAVTDTTITEGPQKGTKRMPIMVLMSDGAPTASTTSYNNVGNSTHGTGGSASISATQSFLTQLSCAWAKAKMVQKYERSALFYTLGLNVQNNINATSVLDPANSSDTITGYWNTFINSTSDSVTYGSGNNGFSVSKDQFAAQNMTDKNYVDSYFSASNDTGLINAFGNIVNQIIIQSKYYPTLVDDDNHNLDGYITFTDELGEYMEVKNIKGLTVAGKLYKGSAIAHAIDSDEFGDISDGDLSQLTELGHTVLKAIQKRLGCTESQAATAVSQALNNNQLSYTDENNYSNYIGWYANENGDYIGYWDGGSTASAPEGAVWVNKSYGFLGQVGTEEEFNLTDMLYISVQVHENIASGHQQVIYKIPASLVPMVNYNISFEGDDLDTGRNFKMSINGADEPLRLIFEVGLRSDINRINLNDKIDSHYPYKNAQDGYRFYTNSWGEHDHEHFVPNAHESTYFDFEPSLENERYYYTYDSTIVDANGDPITVNPRETEGTYYHEVIYFTTEDTALSSAEKKVHLSRISDAAIEDYAQYDALTNTWYIPKNTVFQQVEDYDYNSYSVKKTSDNPTDTLEYSNRPSVIMPSGQIIYHIDACLGNNGTFALKPAQGIELTKLLKYPELATDEDFTFEITLTGDNLANTYPYYNYDGEKLGDVASNGGRITLKAGETVYIVDMPAGTEFTIKEILPVNSTWDTPADVSGEVEFNSYSLAEFVNAPKTYGDLLINKTIVHPFGSDYTGALDKEFEIEVDLAGVADGTVVSVDGVDKTVMDGKLDLTIRHNQNIVIKDIPVNTVYTVTEKTYDGFTLSGSGLSGTITDDKNSEALLVNNYTPSKVSDYNISHTGTKNLAGRDWLSTDEFVFYLEYFNGSNWQRLSGEQTVTAANQGFSFNNLITGFDFTTIGDYQFRVIERHGSIGGITYDLAEKRFTVTVIDDLSGTLKIANVTTNTPYNSATGVGTTVSGSADTRFEVATTFKNTYAVLVPCDIEINITKEISNATNVPLSKHGFTFEIYKIDAIGGTELSTTPLYTSAPTGTDGKTSISLSYDASTLGSTFYYRVKEVNAGADGITYDTTIHDFSVEVYDRLDGSVGAKINGSDTDTYPLTFTNTYTLTGNVQISGTKVLNVEDGSNRTLADGDFEFKLYLCDDANYTNPTEVDSAKNMSGGFTLTDTVTAAGTYYYIVDEVSSHNPTIGDDTSLFYIKVEVTKGAGDTLNCDIVSISKNKTDAVQNIKFVNTYAPVDGKLSLGGEKRLVGRDIKTGEFAFKLYETGSDFSYTEANLIDAANNDNGADSIFTFDDIVINSAKTRYFVIVEDSSIDANGITYDDTVYKVTVTVTDDNGIWKATPSYSTENSTATSVVFTNTYDPEDSKLSLGGKKTLDGRTLAKDEFTFNLYKTDGTFNYSADNLLDSAKNDEDGIFTFKDIPIENADALYFVIVEDSSTKAQGITYDTTVYKVTVTVTDNNGIWKATPSYLADEKAVSTVEFDNTYTPEEPEEPVVPEEPDEPQEPEEPATPEGEPELPQTGDNSNVWLWFALMFISGTGVFAAALKCINHKKSDK